MGNKNVCRPPQLRKDQEQLKITNDNNPRQQLFVRSPTKPCRFVDVLHPLASPHLLDYRTADGLHFIESQKIRHYLDSIELCSCCPWFDAYLCSSKNMTRVKIIDLRSLEIYTFILEDEVYIFQFRNEKKGLSLIYFDPDRLLILRMTADVGNNCRDMLLIHFMKWDQGRRYVSYISQHWIPITGLHSASVLRLADFDVSTRSIRYWELQPHFSTIGTPFHGGPTYIQLHPSNAVDFRSTGCGSRLPSFLTAGVNGRFIMSLSPVVHPETAKAGYVVEVCEIQSKQAAADSRIQLWHQLEPASVSIHHAGVQSTGNWLYMVLSTRPQKDSKTNTVDLQIIAFNCMTRQIKKYCLSSVRPCRMKFSWPYASPGTRFPGPQVNSCSFQVSKSLHHFYVNPDNNEDLEHFVMRDYTLIKSKFVETEFLCFVQQFAIFMDGNFFYLYDCLLQTVQTRPTTGDLQSVLLQSKLICTAYTASAEALIPMIQTVLPFPTVLIPIIANYVYGPFCPSLYLHHDVHVQ